MYFNPYSEANFFQFFVVFLQRIWNFFPSKLASDEIQIIVLSCIACASALLGTFLVLQKMTMLANALSHTSLIGIAGIYLIFPHFQNSFLILIAALISGIVTTFLTNFFSKIIKLQEDASIGLVFTTLFASGILLVTLFAKDAHIGVELVMGNADALRIEDIGVAFLILLANATLIFLFFKELKISTFDPFLASTMHISPNLFRWLLMMSASATTLCAFRAIGALMVLTFLTGPPLIARMITYRLSHLLFMSCSIAIVSVMIAVALSRHVLSVYEIPLSTAGLTVSTLVLFYLVTLLYKVRKNKRMALKSL